MQKTAGAPSEAVPLSFRRRTGGERLEPVTLPHHEQAMPRNRAKRDAKNSRSAERGCSSVLPPPNRRRMVGASNPALPPAGYAAPYAAETSRYVYISHKIHAQSLSYCYVGGRLIAANSIYLINIVRLPHVGRAATKIPSRLQIKGNTAQFPPCGLSTAPAAAARHLRCQNAR